jgi:hypothetical protein
MLVMLVSFVSKNSVMNTLVNTLKNSKEMSFSPIQDCQLVFDCCRILM